MSIVWQLWECLHTLETLVWCHGDLCTVCNYLCCLTRSTANWTLDFCTWELHRLKQEQQQHTVVSPGTQFPPSLPPSLSYTLSPLSSPPPPSLPSSPPLFYPSSSFLASPSLPPLHNNFHIPYSGKLSREKTFVIWQKCDFHGENFCEWLGVTAKGCHAPNFAENFRE